MKALLITTSLVTLLPTWAQAAAVYQGCAVPSLKAGHHTFYVDPVHGSMSGDGSATKPWHTLAEVLTTGTKLLATQNSKTVAGNTSLVDVNPTAPIKPGDVIMLKTGNHGDVKFAGAFNKDFVTVMPAPGQSPVIQSLAMTSSGRWMFQGLKFMPGVSRNRPGGIVAIGYGDFAGTTNNIVMDGNSVSTVDDSSSWTTNDWKTNPQGTGIWTRQNVNCIAINNNHVYNTMNGIAASASQSLIMGNKIDNVFNDGIDLTNSYITIKSNTISGGTNNPLSGYHADGIQAWSPTVNGHIQPNTDVMIDGNNIVKFGDANVSYMQGISIFDGVWQRLTIQNNVVAVDHWNAIAVYGPQDSLIVNNTVIATDPKGHPSWIMVRNAKTGTVSKNVIVRNNLVTQLSVAGTNMQVDHNIATQSIGIPDQKTILTGAVGNSNRIMPDALAQFVKFSIPDQQADLRLKSTSVAVGAGSQDKAPAMDIAGKTRQAPIAVGAYVQ